MRWVVGAALVAMAGPALAQATPAPRIDRAPLLLTDVGALFGPDRYPPSAMRAGEQGRVVARFTVDADGAVGGCAVTESSGSAALDTQTCLSWNRARFEPARDAAGHGVAVTLTRAVRWQLPADAPPPAGPRPPVASVAMPDPYPATALARGEQGRVVARVAVSAIGKATACTVELSSRSKSLDAATCRIALTRVHYLPALAANGATIASETSVPIDWVLPPGALARLCAGHPLGQKPGACVRSDGHIDDHPPRR